MADRRKHTRFPVRLRVYLPEINAWGYTENISLGGCFVAIRAKLATGFITECLLELPVIGAISLKCYIQHISDTPQGMGFQFVQVQFDNDQSEYYNIFAQFLLTIQQLTYIRETYEELVKKDKIKMIIMPDETDSFVSDEGTT